MAQSSVGSSSDIFAQHLKQKKRGRVWRWVGWSTLILVLTGVAFATLTPQGRETVALMTKYAKPVLIARQDPDLLFNNVGSDHVNILLIGRDENWKHQKVYDPKTKTFRPFRVHDEEADARSDTMIVLSLDKNRQTIRMVSLPRDAIVNLPPNPEGVRRTKLNAAHAYGGPAMLIRTLRSELGLTIHRHAVMKFAGFKKLIDQVGGVEVDVIGALKKDRRTGKEYRGNIDYKDDWGLWEVHLKPGKQYLNGEQAHGYVRFRIDREGDPGRIRRQQQVMRALAKKLMHTSPFQLPPLVNEIRRQFETDMNDEELAATAFFARNIGDPSKIQPLTLFATMTGSGDLILNRPKNEKLLGAIFGSTFNPRRFLVRSPETRGDTVGPANNASPEALAVLREAGIVDAEGNVVRSAEVDVPVRVEDTSLDYYGVSAPPRSRRSRVANSEARPSRGTASGSRRSRRTRRKPAADANQAAQETVSRRSTEDTPVASEPEEWEDSGSEGSVPAPESDNDNASHESSGKRHSRPDGNGSSGNSSSGSNSSGDSGSTDSSPIPVPE